MYVDVIGVSEKLEGSKSKDSVISLTIPLTTKTMAINLSNNLVDRQDNTIPVKNENTNSIGYLIIGSIFAIIDGYLIVTVIRYDIKTRTAENIYERELKKILNNYSSYIQVMSSDFDFSEYEPLKIDSFTDMLEVRDTIRQPILMKENKEKNSAYFVIPSNTNILYVYRLKVSDIQKELNEKV